LAEAWVEARPVAPSVARAAIATRVFLKAFMFISLGWVEVGLSI
jgi:hypothetical protein